MSFAAPDYKVLYEKALQETQQVQTLNEQLQQQLSLALLEIDRLRRELFGASSDNRVATLTATRQTTTTPMEAVELAAPAASLESIEEQTKQEVTQAAVETGQAQGETVKSTPEKQEKIGPADQIVHLRSPRMQLPDDLPREEVVIDPAGDLTDYIKIGQEVTEVLEITPASFFVKRIIRTKWALKDQKADSKGVLIAPIPSRTVAKGLLAESLLAYVTISKFVDHLPLHRQIKIFQRQGIHLAASTLSDNIAAVCKQLEPLYNSLKREVLANKYIQADESPIKVQDSEKKGACHQGYFWAYHAPLSKLVLFEYQRGRGQEGPAELLADFRGVLQTDGYGVYSSLFAASPSVTLAACMAHVRRKFDEAVGDDAVRAKYAVEQIGKLYAIEGQIRDNPALEEPDICQKRVLEAGPILAELKSWLEGEVGKVLPDSPIGKAIAYALKLWDRLMVYLYQGQLQIDNNLVENTIRPIALGRKNYLFAGSHAAAQHSAIIYSLLGSCQLNGVNPQQWLEDVLSKLNDPDYEGKFSDLLPNRWKK